jgi:hypothetical protein
LTGLLVIPAVVVSEEDASSSNAVRDLLKQFRDSDDVYGDAFGRHVIIQTDNVESGAPSQVENLKATGSFEDVVVINKTCVGLQLPSGPYFVRGCRIHQACRLYADDLDAFSVAVVPDDTLRPDR